MAFNAQAFRDSLKTIHKPSHFQIFFSGLPSSIFPLGSNELRLFDDFHLRGFNCQLPDISLDVVERRYHGPLRQIPVGVFYQPIQVGLIETHDLKIREIFDHWLNKIIDETDGYYVDYYDNIVSQNAFLYLYDSTGLLIRKYIFEEVFPISTQPIGLDWGLRDTFTTTNVTLVFRKWRREKITPTVKDAESVNGQPLTD